MPAPTVRRTKNLAGAWVTVAPVEPGKPEHSVDCQGCGPVGISRSRIKALGAAVRHAANCDTPATT